MILRGACFERRTLCAPAEFPQACFGRAHGMRPYGGSTNLSRCAAQNPRRASARRAGGRWGNKSLSTTQRQRKGSGPGPGRDRAAGRGSTPRGHPKEGFGNLGFQTALCASPPHGEAQRSGFAVNRRSKGAQREIPVRGLRAERTLRRRCRCWQSHSPPGRRNLPNPRPP